MQSVSSDLGISRASLGYYESGERKPDAEILSRIAKYYKVSSDYLLGLNDEETDNCFNRIKELRIEEGLSIIKLSDALSKEAGFTIDRQKLGRIENGQELDVGVLKVYCKHFDVSADYILGLSDEKSSDVDILALYKKLGLSGESITKIESMSKEQQKTVNFLISSSQFTNLINAIYDYRNNHNADEDLKELHIERNDFFKYCCSRILSDILRGF